MIQDFLIVCTQFIERTERLKKNRKIYFPVQDNPRRLGKSQATLIGPAPVKPGFNPAERQNSPVVRAMFAHRRMRMSNQAVRDDEKPFRTESTSSGRFRAWMNRSHPQGGQLLLRISTVRTTLAETLRGAAQRKTPKGGQKERTHREDH